MNKPIIIGTILLAVITAIAVLLPLSFFVNINEVTYHDMCVGSDIQYVTSQRDVHWTEGYKASSFSELFKYVEQVKVETIIKRKAEFGYQVSEFPITYAIKWNEPINEVGSYGASDLVTIEPFLIKKTAYFSEDEQRFNVILCD